jgi:phosphohistidine phosphatase
MNVFFVRHAEAMPLEKSGVNADADRPLTEHGHAQCRSLAAALLRLGIHLDLILTSPYLRARQTAQGLLDHWSQQRPRVEEREELAPDGKAGKLARYLRQQKPDSVALVGHMPDMARQVSWFMGSKKARLDLDKAGVALLEFDELPDKGTGVLVWLVSPDWFMEKSG